MSTTLSRRNWIKASALLSAGSVVSINNLAFAIDRPGLAPTGEIIPNLNDSTAPLELAVRLNANENPYGPSDKAKEALRSVIDTSFRYPFQEVRQLKKILADQVGLTPEHVILGAGSSEILTLAGMAFGLKNGSIVSAHPSFDTLMRTAARFDCEWIQVPLDSTYTLQLPEMHKAIKTDTRMVYVCNPNNPTGTILPSERLKVFCRNVSAKVPLFIDEAYNDFLDQPDQETVIPLLKEGHDLVVARTFSKIHGFAGLRVGWAYAQPERVKELEKYQGSLSNITMTSVHAAMASLKDTEFQAYCKKMNAEAREYTYSAIKSAGYETTIPSHTSFTMFPIKMEGKTFLKKMEEQGVGVRAWYFNNQNYCRVSIGTLDEMKAFGAALKKIS
jgi:histidinol-phosphate aminotransferase